MTREDDDRIFQNILKHAESSEKRKDKNPFYESDRGGALRVHR